MNRKKGFTLIELLIVIAIIGILSSVILSSLNSARDKGSEAAVKEAMHNLVNQAAIVYDTNGQYAASSLSGCGTAGLFSDPQVSSIIMNIEANAASGTVMCQDSTSTFAVQATFNNSSTTWCVDSSNSATSSILSGTTGLCQ